MFSRLSGGLDRQVRKPAACSLTVDKRATAWAGVSEGTRVCATNLNDGALAEHLGVGTRRLPVCRRYQSDARARPKPAPEIAKEYRSSRGHYLRAGDMREFWISVLGNQRQEVTDDPEGAGE